MKYGHGFMLEHSSGLVLRNNVILASGIVETTGGTSSGVVVVNNTFASDLSLPYTGGVHLVDCPNSTVENNIFYNFPSNFIGALRIEGSAASGLVAGNNLYFRTDGGSHSAPTYPGDIRGQDPRFANPSAGDYHLQTGSPAIDAGVSLGGLLGTDRDGVSRPQGASHDIGAYEFVQSVPQSVPTASPTATVTQSPPPVAQPTAYVTPTPAPRPVITEVKSNRGQARGRTKVKLIGSGFAPGAVVAVNGDVPLTTEVITRYEIAAEVALDLPANVTITVTNPDGASTTLSDVELIIDESRVYLPAVNSR